MKRNNNKILAHLNRVKAELNNLTNEIQENPEHFGDLDSRLFWAIRGADPHTSICSKHNTKIVMSAYGEYVCSDCLDEIVRDVADEHVDNLWFDPEDEPEIKIGLKYTAV